MTKRSNFVANARGSVIGAAASVAGEYIVVPEQIQISGGFLEWRGADGSESRQYGRIGEACLRDFIRLANAPEARFVRFAERYGPLFLGADGYPVELHDLPRRREEPIYPPPPTNAWVRLRDADGREQVFLKGRWQRIWYREPVEGWRAWSRYIGMVYVLCHALRAGERIVIPERRLRQAGLPLGAKNPEIAADSLCLETTSQGEFTFSPLGELVYETLWPWNVIEWLDLSQTAEKQWDNLTWHVNMRLFERRAMSYKLFLGGSAQMPQLAIVRPFSERFSAGTVRSAFPTIAGQLLAAISGGERSQLCADCRLPYSVQRRRANGRCPECGRKARSTSVQRSKAMRRTREASAVGSKLEMPH